MRNYTGGRLGKTELLLSNLKLRLEQPKAKWEQDYDHPFKCMIGTCKERFHHKKDLKLHKEQKHVY